MLTNQAAIVIYAIRKLGEMQPIAVSNAINDRSRETTYSKLTRLVSAGLLDKHENAVYSVTQKGIEELEKYLKVYDEPILNTLKIPAPIKKNIPMHEMALPRQVSKMAGTYVPEKAFYRNDGLKSIKSVGYR